MNFQVVDQANGKSAVMLGTITEFVGEGINPTSQKPWKKAKITDDTGKIHQVTLRGTLPTVAVINQRAQFSIGTYQGTYQGSPYTGYSGFWNETAQVAQSAPPQAQQPTPEATGTSKAPTPAPCDTEMIRIRSDALVCATRLVCAEQLIIGELKSKADEFTTYIAHGKWFADKAPNTDERSEPDF